MKRNGKCFNVSHHKYKRCVAAANNTYDNRHAINLVIALHDISLTCYGKTGIAFKL